MRTQLTPVFASEVIKPGNIYFARLDQQKSNEIKSWWLVLRCSEDLLPQSFLDGRNLQARAFPFWVMGRSNFVWLDRLSLFMPHPSQKSAFTDTEYKDKFDELYDVATGAARTDLLGVFQSDIALARDEYLSQGDCAAIKSADRLLEQRVMSNDGEEDSLFLADDDSEHSPGPTVETVTIESPRKRRRQLSRFNLNRGTTPRSRSVKTPSLDLRQTSPPQAAISPRKPHLKIKTEAEESQMQYALAVSMSERVRIFIGRKQFTTSRVALDRSPVLASFIQQDEVGLFIMHPKLNETREEDFLTVLDFMQRGEFIPSIISRPLEQQGTGPMALEGLNTSEDYSKELIRCGRLYLLGKTFRINHLDTYIVRRITTTQYHPYSTASMITLARIIFRYSGHHRAGFQRTSGHDEEHLEQWLIGALAENFQEIMHNSADRELFWIMEKETTSRRLVAEIFLRCADNYSKIGGLPVKLD